MNESVMSFAKEHLLNSVNGLNGRWNISNPDEFDFEKSATGLWQHGLDFDYFVNKWSEEGDAWYDFYMNENSLLMKDYQSNQMIFYIVTMAAVDRLWSDFIFHYVEMKWDSEDEDDFYFNPDDVLFDDAFKKSCEEIITDIISNGVFG